MFVEHRAGVLATCLAMLRHREEAEDATQEVFARVPHDPAAIADARRWLFEVARNVCIDALRRRQRRPTVGLEATAEQAALQNLEETVLDRMLLHWVIGQLPMRERCVLVHQVLLDQPLGEVARHNGMSYAAAGKLAARAKRRAVALITHDDGVQRRPRCAVA